MDQTDRNGDKVKKLIAVALMTAAIAAVPASSADASVGDYLKCAQKQIDEWTTHPVLRAEWYMKMSTQDKVDMVDYMCRGKL